MDYAKPSKQFIKRGSIAVVIVILLLTAQTNWFKKIFNKSSSDKIEISNKTIGQIIGKDSNGNGISDWEEKLWGLDPTILSTNGVANKDIIENKKKVLKSQQIDSSAKVDETDKLARDLFELTSTLGQSDEVDSQTLKAIASKMGDSVKSKVNNVYSLKDIKTVKTTSESLGKYYEDIGNTAKFFDTESPDIELVIQALENGDTSRLSELNKTGSEYKIYAKQLQALSVPVGIAEYHLNLINGFAGLAESFSYLSQIEDNSINGLVGVAIYKTYNTKISTALMNLREYLTKYGII
jgi:hypothetical protein